jgi:hypothetical protein
VYYTALKYNKNPKSSYGIFRNSSIIIFHAYPINCCGMNANAANFLHHSLTIDFSSHETASPLFLICFPMHCAKWKYIKNKRNKIVEK